MFSRRGFLGGLLAAPFASLIPISKRAPVPVTDMHGAERFEATSGYRGTFATFTTRIPHTIDQPVTLTFNGDRIFAGAVDEYTVDAGGLYTVKCSDLLSRQQRAQFPQRF
jgi:hypothetical protein